MNDTEQPTLRIRIQALGFPLTATLLDHTECRLRFSLTRSRGHIRKVLVRLGETNVSRRGVDKFCRIQVYLQQAAPVLIEDTDADLYALIERVAERAGRSVAMLLNPRTEHGWHVGFAECKAITTKRESSSMNGR